MHEGKNHKFAYIDAHNNNKDIKNNNYNMIINNKNIIF